MHITDRVLTRNQRLAFDLLARGEPLLIYEQRAGNHAFYMVRVLRTGWHIGSYLKGLRERKWVRYVRGDHYRPKLELTRAGWIAHARMQIEWPAVVNWDWRSEPPVIDR